MDEIASVIAAFESTELPLSDWHHREHLIVAWHYLRTAPAQAEELVRNGIQRYNASKGIATTPTGGYHETFTMFFVALVRASLDDALPREEEIARILETCSFDRIFTHYSKDVLRSLDARRSFVAPDLLK